MARGPQLPHPPREEIGRQSLEIADLWLHSRGAPLVGVANKTLHLANVKHIGPVGIEQATNRRERAVDIGIE